MKNTRLTVDTLLLAFANQSAHPLPTLQEEDDALSRLLAPRVKSQHFTVQRESFATLERLPSFLTLYRDSLVLFLFSGHAGRDRLLLGDGSANANGIAQMLGQCPNLRLVFLNGCSTAGQVSTLLEQGVPMVIATSAPVSDRKAAQFSIFFFEAMLQQFTVGEAFNMAKGALATTDSSLSMAIHRSIGAIGEEGEEGGWGLYCTERTAHHLDWKLRLHAVVPDVAGGANFTPNQRLIEVLFKALSEYNETVRKLYQQDQRKVQPVALTKKRLEIINALPSPLAEPLRKLMVPIEQENEGYDKISAARLRQIIQAYNTSMELLGFTMLAQLWEAYDQKNGALTMSAEQRQGLHSFFKLSKTEREGYDFLELIKKVKAVFDQNDIRYFVQELADIRDLIQSDEQFAESLQFLNSLRLQVRHQPPDPSTLAYLSQRAEDCLAYLYSKLGFMARYRLATIQGIDVEKYRHRRQPSYNHATGMLYDSLGGFSLSEVHLEKPLDNHSILLVNEETWDFLNLSPFVIDENAYEERADVCKLFFFSHYLQAADTCCYKYINQPSDPLLEISEFKHPFVKEQLDAFIAIIHDQPVQIA